ncbi:hypothetical protein [Lacimicrobium alkaliphilum]|uniref:hypothetical protein n=1 Tax=Lacimicrobium alkaliphilum TaxID=1526571 RepID=UPI000BFEBE1A|nr:hypothetical protein [Lacimicrobium alkaliphilum]
MYNTLSTTIRRYIFAAVLARSATGAAIVAVVLLARDNGAGGAFSGALAACLTLPHLLGPLYGRWLEHAANPCGLIGSAALIFVASFQAAIISFGADLPVFVTLLLLLCGTCGSFIMGGLSTQLIPLIGADHVARRKAQSLDTATYAVGTTCGPLLLAVLTSAYSIQIATGVVMALPLISGIVIFSLGKRVHHTYYTAHTR